MLSWALLAGGALTYLSLSSFQTIGPDGSRATPSQSTPESNRVELDRAMLTAQVRELNKTVSSLRTRMAKLKTAQQTASSNDVVANQAPSATPTSPSTDLNTSAITTSSIAKPDTAPLTVASDGEMARLTESKAPSAAATTVKTATSTQLHQPKLLNSTTTTPISSAGTASARAEAPATAEGKPNRRRNLATSPLRPGSVPPLPPFNTQKTSQNPAIKNAAVNPLQPKPLDRATGSIRTASLPVPTSLKPQQPAPVVKTKPARPFAFGKPTVTQRQANASAAALSLSTAQSVTGLRASWLLLTSRHPATFVGYQPRYIADQANGTYRLIAGPIANHAEADRICNELRAQHVNCGVTSYAGSSLK